MILSRLHTAQQRLYYRNWGPSSNQITTPARCESFKMLLNDAFPSEKKKTVSVYAKEKPDNDAKMRMKEKGRKEHAQS